LPIEKFQPKKRTCREAQLESVKPDPEMKKKKVEKRAAKKLDTSRQVKAKKNFHERLLVKQTCLPENMKKELKKVPDKFTNIIVDDGDID